MKLREMGLSQRRAASQAKVSEAWAKGFERNLRDSSGASWREAREGRKLSGPVPYDQLCVEAQRAWNDFEYFRRRYMGRISTPWQVETANIVVEALASPSKEFIVENAPPGGGKSTLLHDLSCWVTVRDRRIRGLHGSRIENNARRQARRVRRTLERTSPAKAPTELLERGLAVDAEACLAADYGLFKPQSSDVWKADEFIVAQFDDLPIEEKEPTWSSYGMDSGVLGNRFNLILWDDVVDKTVIRTLEAQTNQRQWWDDEAETRLEPAGVLLLVGQRMSASDLYRYCLDKTVPADEDEPDDAERPRLYRHVVFQAHSADRCLGAESHRKDSPAFPEGCLLDPYRLPWSDLRKIEATKKNTFRVQYQQEDADPEDVLVPDVWISGGTDPEDSNALRPGCWDENRDLCELPKGLNGPLVSVAMVDPSGTKMWALEWLISAPNASDQTFLMDLERRAMPANELLDWDANRGVFYGWMEDWQARSVKLGYPITHWIVEVNAAQRYLLAYDHVRRWMGKWGVSIVPHTTGPRKLDEEHGPWIMREDFKFGRFRLPGKQGLGTQARIKSLKLVDELTRWPNAGVTSDLVMATWFFYVRKAQLTHQRKPLVRSKRPSWMRKGAA